MTPLSALIEDLAAAIHLPAPALRKALEHPEAIAEATLPLLNAAAEGEEIDQGQANLVFWGLHLMASARDTRALAPLLGFLRQDGEFIDAVLGDAVTATLSRVLASLYDGQAEPLFRLILDSSLDDGIREAILAACTFLCLDGRIDRDALHRVLVRFDDAKASVEGDIGWTAWEEAIATLGFRDLAPRVEAARKDGRIDPEHSDPTGSRRPCARPSATRTTGSAFRRTSTAIWTIPSPPSNGPARAMASPSATRSRMSAGTTPAPAAPARSSRNAASARSRPRRPGCRPPHDGAAVPRSEPARGDLRVGADRRPVLRRAGGADRGDAPDRRGGAALGR